VVVGLGAAGRAGKASSRLVPGVDLARVGFLVLVVVCQRAPDEGREAVALLDGNEGNADDDDDDETASGRLPCPLATTADGCSTLDRRDCCVEFLSLRTRVVCLWLVAAVTAGELADAAAAQPLLDVVAPCMPPSPGNVG
jgi:hypothetical protein